MIVTTHTRITQRTWWSDVLRWGLVALLASSGAVWAEEYNRGFEGTTIRVLDVARDAHRVGLEFIVPMFEERYGIQVEVVEMPFPRMREATVLEMLGRTGRYDVFSIDVMWLAEYVQSGYLEPLYRYINDPNLYSAEILDLDGFVPRALSGNGVQNDMLYTLPISPGMYVQFLRKDLLEEAGIAVPQTEDELLAAAEALTIPGRDQYGITLQIARGIFFGHQWLRHLYTFGGQIWDEDWNVVIDSPEALRALDHFLQYKPFTPPGSESFQWDDVSNTFAQGRAAMGEGFSAFMITFENPEASRVAGKVDYTLVPYGPSGNRDALYGSWAMGISTDSRNKEAAYLFLQYVAGTEVAREWALRGGQPSRHSVFQDPEVQATWPWMSALYDFLLNHANPDFRPRIPEWAEIAEIIGLWGNRAWSNEVTSREALAGMQREIENVMTISGYYAPGRTQPPQHWRDLTYYDRMPSQWNLIRLPDR
jgi:multiple sugar transport system substrate-binding protein